MRFVIEHPDCNMDCKYCFSDWRENDKPFSTKEVLDCIDILASKDVKRVSFTGGEPLLRGDIEELLTHAKSYGMHTLLCTNGTILSEKIGSIADVVDSVVLPIDSADAAVHNTLRSNDLVRDHHRLVLELIDMLEKIYPRIRRCVNSTATAYNKDTFVEIGELIQHKAPRWIINDFRPVAHGQQYPELCITDDEFGRIVRECRKRYPGADILALPKGQDNGCRIINSNQHVLKTTDSDRIDLGSIHDYIICT